MGNEGLHADNTTEGLGHHTQTQIHTDPDTHLLKWFPVQVHDDVGVHVEETAVRVVREAGVARGVDDALGKYNNQKFTTI